MRGYLDLAIRIAGDSLNSFQHGAVLVNGGRVIATAPNIMKNNPTLFLIEHPEDEEAQRRGIRTHCSVHAEARVVKKAGSKARGSIVYAARVNRHGEPMMSRPCAYCYTALAEAGVKAVVYTETVDGREYRSATHIQKNRAAYSSAA